jgi:exodeoxyribonuclease V
MTTASQILKHLPFASPTAEQVTELNAIAQFVDTTCNDDFYILSGAAGTGKTSITTAVVQYLIDQKIRFHIIAPTGRATRILGEKAGVYGHTIHSKIYSITTESDTGFVFCHLKKVSDEDKVQTIFIIDESSMVAALPNADDDNLFKATNSLLTDIAKYVKTTDANSKILFLGDENQLPPIGENNSQALNEKYIAKQFNWHGKSGKLTQVMRQQDDSYIMNNAITTRLAIEGNLPIPSIDAYKFADRIYGASKHYVKNYLNFGPDDAIAIGCTNNSNIYFNDIVRKELYGKQVAKITKGDYMLVTQGYERNGIKLYSGDHVLIDDVGLQNIETIEDTKFVYVRAIAKNRKNENVMMEDLVRLDLVDVPQGHRGLPIENKLRQTRYAKCKKLQEHKRSMDDKYLGALKLTYGHAITCNKAQGGEWNKVYMNTWTIPNAKWQYTAITRAKNELVLF